MQTDAYFSSIKFGIALLIFASFCMVSADGSAQEAGGTKDGSPAAMPSDPEKLMQLAAHVNGLTGPDVKPWHLKASYKLFDENGKTIDEGTYEEFWASPTRFKRTFTGGAFTQSDYGTEKGILRSGQRQPIPILVSDIRRDLITPLPAREAAAHMTFTLQPVDAKGVKISCLRATSLPASSAVYCLMPDRPIVVINTYTNESLQVIHNRILGFQGRYVPGDLAFQRGTRVLLSAHIEDLRSISSPNGAQFLPSADATLLPRKIYISGGVAAGQLLKHSYPIYPPLAKASRVSGTVVLQAVIGTDGHISDLQVISGPPMLQQAALDTVSTWTYRPYLLNGDPVEVNTTINVVFTLGG
jgi:TonB family protein